MDAPSQGLRFWKREKVCGEAGRRSAKLGEEPVFGLLKGQSLEARHCVFVQSLTTSFLSPGPCLPAGARTSQTHPRAFMAALVGWPAGFCPWDCCLDPRPLKILVSLLEPDVLLGRGLPSK